MKLNTGMRYHDLCPKMEMEELSAQVKEHDIRQIQLTSRKSISDYDFTTGHYSSGFARTITRELERNRIHVVVLGCYISPTNPTEPRCQIEVARFIGHIKYARIIGADVVGTETGCLNPGSRIIEESYTEDACRLPLESMGEIMVAAEKPGVIIGVEGVFNHTLYNPVRMKRSLEDIDSPNVEVALDAVSLIHPHQVEPETQKQVIDRASAYYGDRIEVLHMKDFVFNDREWLFRHVGDGPFRYESLMKHVKERESYIVILLENPSRERYHEDVKSLQQIYDRIQREIQEQPVRDSRP